MGEYKAETIGRSSHCDNNTHPVASPNEKSQLLEAIMNRTHAFGIVLVANAHATRIP